MQGLRWSLPENLIKLFAAARVDSNWLTMDVMASVTTGQDVPQGLYQLRDHGPTESISGAFSASLFPPGHLIIPS